MKKFLFLSIAVFFGFILSAQTQTQQGYVKTLGRPDKAGEPLGGVSVRVKGGHNEVLSGSDGTFEMRMDGKKNGEAYALQSVQKAGYELNENDIIGRQFAFSDKVRLEIVMVSSSVLQAEKRRIEDNAYRTAERNYKAKASQIEQQLQDSAISIQQYRERMAELQDKFEKYQSLIDGLAEHYAHTDYDFLSETDREINICIENGELERADSLINTLFDPIGVLERNMEALARIEQQMDQAQGMLSQANEDMAAVLKQQEKDAEYLYQLYTIALAQYDQEKAGHYITTRALLDSTNAQWQVEAGFFLVTHNNYVQAEHFYDLALLQYRSMSEDELAFHGIEMAFALNNLGNIYKNTNRKGLIEDLYIEALEISDELWESGNRQACSPMVLVLSNLAKLYCDSQRFDEAWEMIEEGLEIFSMVSQDSTLMNPSSIMSLMSFMSITYQMLQNSFFLSTEIASQVLNTDPTLSFLEEPLKEAEQNPLSFGPAALPILKIYADLYAKTQQFDRCESLKIKALEVCRKMAEADPTAHTNALLQSLEDLANFYFQINRFADSEALFNEALALVRQLNDNDPFIYAPALGEILCNTGNLYLSMGMANQDFSKLKESEQLLNEALPIYRSLAQRDPERYEQSLFGNLTLLGNLYQTIGSLTQNEEYLTQSEQAFEETIEIGRRLAEIYPEMYEPHLVNTLLSLGKMYFTQGSQIQDTTYFQKSEKLVIESVEISRRLAQYNPQAFESGLAGILITYGSLLREWGKCEQSGPLFDEGLSLWRHLSAENADQYELGLAEALYFAAQYDAQCGQIQDAISLTEETLSIIQRHENASPMLYLDAMNQLSNLYVQTEEYDKAYRLYSEMHSIMKAMHLERSLAQPNPYVVNLGNKAYCAIFMKKFAEAEQCAREALEIDITQKWIFTNLAAALLFQGKYAEAEEIYAFLKPELRDSLLEDLVAYEEAGIIPRNRKADVERIRQMLNE